MTCSSLAIAAVLTLLACSAPPAAPQTALDIPFEYDGHIFFHARINGDSARLLLDPVDGLMLDRRFALARPGMHRDWREAGMQGRTMVGGAGSAEVEVSFADSVTLVLGDMERSFPRLYVVPLDSMMSGAISGRVDGLFGTTLLAEHALRLDFVRRRAQLLDPATVDTTGWSVLPLTFVGARAIVPVTVMVGDTVPYEMDAVVDFGMSPNFRVSTREVDARRMMRHAPQRFRMGRGLGGDLVSRTLAGVRIRLGTTATDLLPIDLAREPSGGDADPPYDALLGLGVLSQFDVIYDPTNARMLLRKVRDA